MIPCLYNSTETAFATNGIGKLADTESCTVEEKRNGSFELKLTYPSTGIHAESLTEGNIILAVPSVQGTPQPFEIYKATTDLSGKIEIQARHISYRLNFITVSPFTAESCSDAIQGLKTHAATECQFTFETDIDSKVSFKLTVPASLRNCLGGMDGSVLDTYGGEYEWDGFNVKLHKARGRDNGVRIVYGTNLTDFTMEKSIENVITGVHPYWKSGETDDLVQLTEKVVTTGIASPYQKITVLDCSSDFQEKPSEEKLRNHAQSYLKTTSLTEPEIDISIDFAELRDAPGYSEKAERVSMCDTVHVYVTKLGLEISSKVTETVYDVLLERYTSVTLSNAVIKSRNTSLPASLNSIRSKATAAYSTAVRIESAVNTQIGDMNLQIASLEENRNYSGELLSALFGLKYESGVDDYGNDVCYAYDGATLSESTTAWKNSTDGFFISTDGGATWEYGWDGDTPVKTAVFLQRTLSELDTRYETAKKLSEELLAELDVRYKTASAISDELQAELDKKYQAVIATTEPPEPELNTLWIDKTDSRLKLWDGNKWIVIGYEPEGE